MYHNDVYNRWQTRKLRQNIILGVAGVLGVVALLSVLGLFVYMCIQGLL